MGVKYILEGSVQRAGDRVRITAQLIDATTDYHMWSKSYDRDLSDIFALQDEITIKLMNAMSVNLTDGEQSLLYVDEIKNIKAFDKYLRGIECFYRVNRQHNAQARKLFEQASKLEDTSATLYTFIGFTHIVDFLFNWSESPSVSFAETEINTKKAIALNDSIDLPYILKSWIHLFKKEYDKAIVSAKHAVDINPNGADAIAHLGFITLQIGEPEKAIVLLQKAFRLNPIPPPYFYHFLGMAYSHLKQYEKAVEILNRSLSIDSEALTPHLVLATCYIDLNEFDKAHKTVERVLEIDPKFSIEYQKSISISNDQAEAERYFGNLRKAGLPD